MTIKVSHAVLHMSDNVLSDLELPWCSCCRSCGTKPATLALRNTSDATEYLSGQKEVHLKIYQNIMVLYAMQMKRSWSLSCTSTMFRPRPLPWTWCVSWRPAAQATGSWHAN